MQGSAAETGAGCPVIVLLDTRPATDVQGRDGFQRSTQLVDARAIVVDSCQTEVAAEHSFAPDARCGNIATRALRSTYSL